ncbi:MAG: Ig-like domain-containing protein [Myxococcaceae bacterium]
MRASRPVLAGLALLFALGCNKVDYIEIKPDNLILRQRNNEIWLQGHAMSRTGVHHSRTNVGWMVKDESVAKVDSTGKLTAVKSGHTELVATVGKVTAVVPVDVLFAEKLVVTPLTLQLVEGGKSQELEAKVYDYLGRPLRDRSPMFHSLDEKVANLGQNAVFPVGPGTTTIEVRVEELKQTVEVTVEPEKKAAKK